MVDLPSLASPAPTLSDEERRRAWRSMWFKDHGFIRDMYCNRRVVAKGVWRSAQPAPHHIKDAKETLGVTTVLNLRGERPTCGAYILEQKACEDYGVKLINFPIRSRGALEKETLIACSEVFDETVQAPFLLHCKSGADRAGFMSTLYLFLKEGVPLRQAMDHLSLKYGHIKQAKTGVIDFFFETFLEQTDGQPASFRPWLENEYDAQALNKAFKENWVAGIIVNKILRRE